MFHLTKGILKKLVEAKESLFNRSAQSVLSVRLNTSVENSGIIRLNMGDKLCIVMCDEIIADANNKDYAILVNDGESKERVLLDTDFCVHNLNKTDYQLEAGCVILVNEISYCTNVDEMYACIRSSEIQLDNEGGFLPDDSAEKIIKTTIVLRNFILLGTSIQLDIRLPRYTENSNKISQTPSDTIDATSSGSDDDDNDNSQSGENLGEEASSCSIYSIDELKQDYSNSEWSIRCQLKAKTKRIEFNNAYTLNGGHKMRMQLYDGLKYIEAVAFNELIEKLERLEINEIYLFSNGNIRNTKRNFRAWPNQSNNSEYDIIVRKDTLILHLKNYPITKLVVTRQETSAESNSQTREEESVDSNESKSKQITDNAAPSLSSSTTSNTTSLRQDIEVFVKIDQLIFKRADTRVNVVGIVYELHDLRYMTSTYGQRLEVLNFDLVDETKTLVRVALWGQEAKKFKCKKGDCIMLKQAKTCTYGGGLSLSKLRDSFIFFMNTNSSTAVANLIKWYASWINTSEHTPPISCASKIQKQRNAKKRGHASIEYSIAKPTSSSKSEIKESPNKKQRTK